MGEGRRLVHFILKTAHFFSTHMIFGGKNFIKALLELQDRSSFEIGCWNYTPFFKKMERCIKSE